MKITGKSPYVNLGSYVKNIKDNANADAASGRVRNETPQSDKVVLSPKAKEIQEVKRLLDSIPEIREEKVALISEQIEKGTYEVDGKKIAQKMLRESLLNELL